LFNIGSNDGGAVAKFVFIHIILTTFKLPTSWSNHTFTHWSSIDLTHFL
jgi:hypothetical protein